MTFYAAPAVDPLNVVPSDLLHVQNTDVAIKNDCDSLSVNADGRIWVALRNYTVEGTDFAAVVFCDENNEDYQVAISDNRSEAQEEYRSTVLALADQAVSFAKSDVTPTLLSITSKGGNPGVSKRPKFLHV